ncbi:dihydrodipicolinate synthase family protein [Sulfodiicoccus acidiphilus]|uniref:Dihydrodipicolinate synthase family protein n=1 Tax=Sulfodiicoccus acidiphilus TaxID=1670455 RepID=A0A348B2A1_9CREN|nr:dihydrodipicolinate synthase family protein [Sulfodiicoccus acidiphilus]BBD72303.1 dihydrodipicolinate synthase family protein [Sulfodiicoccus acidiphilus]GGT90407.1 dihydrodipicolinate synthase family protein [Sulfodiicoccus acidiphilus]
MKGIVVPIVTPFNEKEELDLDALGEVTRYLLREGIEWIMALGTTGEFNMLSEEEKVLVVRTVVEHGKGKVIAGINENSSYNAAKLAKQYADVGASELITIPPLYHRTDELGIVKFYESIAKVGLPVYVYNIPSLVGYEFPPTALHKLVEEGVVSGMKYTTSDLVAFLRLTAYAKEANSSFNSLMGEDRLIVDAIARGADGTVAGSGNVAPELVVQAVRLTRDGNLREALKIQEKLTTLVEAIMEGDYPALLKAAMRYRGVSGGKCRSPLHSTPESEGRVYTVMKSMGL